MPMFEATSVPALSKALIDAEESRPPVAAKVESMSSLNPPKAFSP
jgi:hypothetical protein